MILTWYLKKELFILRLSELQENYSGKRHKNN